MAQTLEAIAHQGPFGPFLDRVFNTAIDGGKVVDMGGSGLHRLLGVTHRPSAADEQSAPSAGGIYKFKKKAGATFSNGDRICWDFGLGQAVISSDGTADVHLGTCVGLGQTGTNGALSDDDYVVGELNKFYGEEPTST
jgi:predicted RecA/RadA family phage recombinase